MGLANLVSLVASLHRNNEELGQDDGSTDGGGYFPGALTIQTVVIVVDCC